MASEGVSGRASVEVVAQQLGSCRVAQLGHGFGLDLPDALPGHPVDLADLVEGLGLAVGQPEPHRDHPGHPFGQGVQHRVQLLLQQREAHRLTRLDRLGVLDQVTELAVAVLTQRRVWLAVISTVYSGLEYIVAAARILSKQGR